MSNKYIFSLCAALTLISCGGGGDEKQLAQPESTQATEKSILSTGGNQITSPPTVTISIWKLHNDGLCGAATGQPFIPYSFDLQSQTSTAMTQLFVNKMKSICNGQMANTPYFVTNEVVPMKDLFGTVYLNSTEINFTKATITWGENIKQAVGNLAPYGTITCPLGYTPESPDTFDKVNAGIYPVTYGSKCIQLPTVYNSPKNLGKSDHCHVLDPINQATGNEVKTEIDLTLPGSFNIVLKRTYNSDISAGIGIFGAHWTTAFDRALVSTPGIFGFLESVRPDGKRIGYTYTDNSSGMWTTMADVRDTMQQLVDSSNVLIGRKYVSAPDDEVEIYNVAGQLISITNRAGQVISYTYTSGRLTKVTDPFGRSLTFAYGTAGLVSQVTDSMNRAITFSYDRSKNLASVSYPDGKIRRYVYNESTSTGGVSLPFALTGIIDEAGQRHATINYNSLGLAIGSELAGGAGKGTIGYTLDPNGRITQAQVQVGTAAPTVHDVAISNGKALVTKSTSPCWSAGTATQRVEHPYEGTTGTRTDLNGVVTNVIFDSSRKNETSRTEAYGTPNARNIVTEWHPTYRLPTRITEPGRASEFTYDAAGNLTGKSLRDLATNAVRAWTYSYDSFGRVLTINGPRTDVSDVTTLTYDTAGNLATSTDALGRTTKFTTYDALGHLIAVTDPNGLTTRFAYDTRYRITKVSYSAEDTSYTYTPSGDIQSILMPTGAKYTFGYDAAHRLTSITDAEGSKIIYTLDTAGNKIKEDILSPSGSVAQTKSKEFDAMNQMIAEIGALGQRTTFGYDGNGNTVSVDDPLRNTTRITVDTLNRLKSITNASNGVITPVFDTNDKLRTLTDPNGNQSIMAENALGDTSSTTLPAVDGGFDPATYDSAGNIRTKYDFRGVATSYTYDALNRLTAVTSTGGTSITFTYDEGTYGIGHLTRMNDSSGVTRWTYDIYGRTISDLRQTSNMTIGPRYVYVPGGQVSSITYPSGRSISYKYLRGKLTSTLVDGATVASSITSQPFSGISGWTWANGQTYQRQYNSDGLLASYSMGSGIQTLQYDAANRLIGISDSSNAALNQTFGYDSLNRVVNYDGPNGNIQPISERYQYDANGNRISINVNGQSHAYTYDSGSNSLRNVQGPQAQTWSFLDASTVSDGARSFSYDGLMRMSAVTSGSNRTDYIVDGLGRRVSKKTGTKTTYYIYGLSGELLSESLATNSAIVEYLWFPEPAGAPQLLAVSPGTRGVVNYVFTDQLNTPRLVTNSGGVALWRWTSDPFGNTSPVLRAGGFIINLRFAGQQFDGESGLYYNRHRYYDPRTGRYTQSDPIGLAGGINTYAYVGGNPLSYVDPDGLNPALAVYRAGVTGYRIGEAINPSVQPVIASAVDALLLPDFNDPSIILAQNNRHTRDVIKGLEEHIAKHKKKLEQEPNCDAANHWRNEIAAAEAKIARLRLRLPNGR